MASLAMPTRAPLKRPLTDTPMLTNLGGQPLPPTPIQAPTLPPSPQAPTLPFTPTTVGAAPTPTATGTFVPPTLPGGMDPYQWRVDQANKGANRSAAAHGTLLSGGFQAALAKLNQGLASEEADKIYGRSLSAYTTNRDTNQQNYGQQLAGYNAGTGATLDAARLNLSGQTAGYDRTYQAGRDAYGDARDAATTQTGVINANAQAEDLFRQQMEQYRAEVDAQRQADMARQNAATTAAQGTFPVRRPMYGTRTRLG